MKQTEKYRLNLRFNEDNDIQMEALRTVNEMAGPRERSTYVAKAIIAYNRGKMTGAIDDEPFNPKSYIKNICSSCSDTELMEFKQIIESCIRERIELLSASLGSAPIIIKEDKTPAANTISKQISFTDDEREEQDYKNPFLGPEKPNSRVGEEDETTSLYAEPDYSKLAGSFASMADNFNF